MSHCLQFIEKWKRHPNFCDLSPDAVRRIDNYIGFLDEVESEGTPISSSFDFVTEGAIRPLFEECAGDVRVKVSEAVKESIKTKKHPVTGQFVQKLAQGDIKEIIQKVRGQDKPPVIPYVSIEELPKPEPKPEPELKPKKIEEWKRPFQRPRIISEGGEQVQVQMSLSVAEFDFVKKISDGVGMLDLSRAYDCDVATIHREIRVVAQKITAGRML